MSDTTSVLKYGDKKLNWSSIGEVMFKDAIELFKSVSK